MADVEGNPDPLRILDRAGLARAVGGRDALVCLVQDTVDAEVIAAGAALRVIATMTITPEQIDLAAATARGIPVTTIPPMVTEATADLALALLLAVARRVVEADGLVRAGVFPGAQSCRLEGLGVSGKTLGLLGCGRVCRAVARRARGFGMRLLYTDPRPPRRRRSISTRSRCPSCSGRRTSSRCTCRSGRRRATSWARARSPGCGPPRT